MEKLFQNLSSIKEYIDGQRVSANVWQGFPRICLAVPLFTGIDWFLQRLFSALFHRKLSVKGNDGE